MKPIIRITGENRTNIVLLSHLLKVKCLALENPVGSYNLQFADLKQANRALQIAFDVLAGKEPGMYRSGALRFSSGRFITYYNSTANLTNPKS